MKKYIKQVFATFNPKTRALKLTFNDNYYMSVEFLIDENSFIAGDYTNSFIYDREVYDVNLYLNNTTWRVSIAQIDMTTLEAKEWQSITIKRK